MTLLGKNKGFGIQDFVTNGVASSLQDHLAGSITICEPWFGEGSIILSRVSPAFKVRVINDQDRSLVAFFEMNRIDKDKLFELVNSDDPSKNETAIAMLDGKSPFLESMTDVMHGIQGFFSCLKNLDIPRATVVETTDSFVNTIHEIHCLLESVLVENMPVDEIIPRFDKSYTTFFIPSSEASALMDNHALMSCFTTLKGRVLVQCNAASIEALETRFIACSEDRLMLDFELRGENDACYVGFKARV